MPRIQVAIAGLAFCGLLAACGQQQQAEPQPVYPQPTFDKSGDASCPDGLVPGRTSANAPLVCLPPPPGGECPPGQTNVGAANDVVCIPEQNGRDPDEPGGGRQPGANNPTGAPGAALP
jgi:hypothetical protein